MNAKITMFIILIVAVSITLALVIVIPKKERQGIGLVVGAWAKYENTFAAEEEMANITQSFQIEILQIEGTNITFALESQLSDGGQTNDTITVNSMTGKLFSPYNWSSLRTLSLSPSNYSVFFSSASAFFIIANRTIGEPILGNIMNITSESRATYAGQNRDIVGSANDEYAQDFMHNAAYVTDHSATFSWDQWTGVLLRCSFSEYFGSADVGQGLRIFQRENQDFKLVDTNVW